MEKSMNKELTTKALTSNITKEELIKCMEMTTTIDSEELLEILIDVTKEVDSDKLEAIIKLVPIEHQYLLELLVSLMDDNECAETIDETIQNIKCELLKNAKKAYEEDTSITKDKYIEKISSLTKEEQNYLLNEIKGDKQSEFSAFTKKIIKSSLEEKKIK